MVSVAHLKPIQAKTQSGTRADVMLPSWTFSADGALHGADQEASIAAVGNGLNQEEPSTPPSSSGDFTREWRRGCSTADARYRYLRLTTPSALASIFRVEIRTDLLREILTALESSWLSQAGAAEDRKEGSSGVTTGAAEEIAFVVQCLLALSTAGRFSLTVRLLGSSGKATLESLFQSLQEALIACPSDNEGMSYHALEDLAKNYGVKLMASTD